MQVVPVLFILILFITGCQNNSSHDLQPPYTAEIISLIPLSTDQKPSESPSFILEPKTFKTLSNLSKLESPYFKMHRGGNLVVLNSELTFKTETNVPLSYFIVKNILIPQDYITLTMLSSFYQFETIVSELKNLTGISIEDITNRFGKFEVFFEPTVTEESNGILRKTYERENAAYLPDFHKFILLLRSKKESVPLPINLQVISHEFGHSVWEYMFQPANSRHTCDRFHAEYVVAGLNEGFSDFLSYTLTGSTNILQNSFNYPALANMRNFSLTNFTYAQIAAIADTPNNICNQSFYCVGTLFANALFNAQQQFNEENNLPNTSENRAQFLTKISAALINTRKNITFLPITPSGFDPCVVATNNTSVEYDALILALFFDSFLSQIQNKSIQKSVCHALVQNFENFADFYREKLTREEFCL